MILNYRKILMKRVYEIWGIQRSGNHAILNWLIENLCDNSERHSILDEFCFHTDNLLFLNAVVYNNELNFPFDDLRKYLKLKCKYVLLSYEDSNFDKSLGLPCKKFIVMRNLENLVASRMHVVGSEWLVDDDFFNRWEMHARSDIPKIHYDKWLVDKRYRDSIAQMFNTKNKDITNIISSAGFGSSFIGQRLDSPENLLSRHRQIDIPPDIKEKIIYYGERNPEFCNIQQLKVI